MPTLVSTHQLLGHTGDLDVAKGLKLVHLLGRDGVLPHGSVHGWAEEQGLVAVPRPDDTRLQRRTGCVWGPLLLDLPPFLALPPPT